MHVCWCVGMIDRYVYTYLRRVNVKVVSEETSNLSSLSALKFQVFLVCCAAAFSSIYVWIGREKDCSKSVNGMMMMIIIIQHHLDRHHSRVIAHARGTCRQRRYA